MSKKHQIILIRGPKVDSLYTDLLFIESVTDWDEVTDEELEILRRQEWAENYQIVERNPSHVLPSKAGLRSPRDYIEKYRADVKLAAERAKKRAMEDSDKKLERKRKQLAKLKEELGE